MVVGHVLLQQVVEVPFAERHEVVQALMFHRLHTPLREGVQDGRMNGQTLGRTAVFSQHLGEASAALRVANLEKDRRPMKVCLAATSMRTSA